MPSQSKTNPPTCFLCSNDLPRFFQMSKERAFLLTGLLFGFWFVSLIPGFIPCISDGAFHGMKLNVMQRCCSFTSAITESRITFNTHKTINTRRELWLHNPQDRLERYRNYGTPYLSLPILEANSKISDTISTANTNRSVY